MESVNCMSFEKTKGKFVIVVKEPKDNVCTIPMYFSAVGVAMDIKLTTNSTFIGYTDKPMLICATYAMNKSSKSEYVIINPDEFTMIDVDYNYYMHDGKHCVEKVVLKVSK